MSYTKEKFLFSVYHKEMPCKMTQFSESCLHITSASSYHLPLSLKYELGKPQKNDMKFRTKAKQVYYPTFPTLAALDWVN